MEHIVDLTDAISVNDRRTEMMARVWSADGRRLAVDVSPEGCNGRRDLVAITRETLDVEYVASMDGSSPVWTTRDFRWEGERLVTVGDGHYARIVRNAEDDREWKRVAPRPGAARSASDCR